MLPKISAAERAQFKAQAKNVAAAEIRSKKRHSMNAATTTPATTIPPPPQTENPIPVKMKGKETAVVLANPPATRSKRTRGLVLPGISIQEPSTNSAPPSPKKFKATSDKDWSLKSASQDLISAEEMKGIDLSLPAEASAFHRKPWAMTLDILQRLPIPTDRATFQSLEVTENIDNTMRNLFLVITITHIPLFCKYQTITYIFLLSCLGS